MVGQPDAGVGAAGDPNDPRPNAGRPVGWQTAVMAPNGDLVVVVHNGRLLRLDWASRTLWSQSLHAHHSVALDEKGNIYVITAAVRHVEVSGKARDIADNGVAVLDAQGKPLARFSLYDVLMASDVWRATVSKALEDGFRGIDAMQPGPMRSMIARLAEQPADSSMPDMMRAERGDLSNAACATDTCPDRVDLLEDLVTHEWLAWPDFFATDLFHANAVVPLKKLPRGLWDEGDVLVSIRHLSLLAVINPKTGRVGWSWGPGELEGQHQPTVRDDGHVVVFDNRTTKRRSRLVEVNPETKTIVWQYEDPGFFDFARGCAQALPGGNVLVANSSRGRIFEVTPSKDIVWEYYDPDMPDAQRHYSLYQVYRVAPEVVDPLLARAGTSRGATPSPEDGGRRR
jgi:hypothetical protein